MNKSTIDSRVSRTRSLLQNALLSLTSEKSYDGITVDDICATANVGRSTFYAHYTSKDDLKRKGIDGHLRDLFVGRQKEAVLAHRCVPSGRRFGFSLAMFEHARDHRAHYRALAGGRGSSVALAAIRQVIADLVREEFASTGPVTSAHAPTREFSVQFVVGAYMSVLLWWLDGGAKLSPEQVDAMFRHLATEGFSIAS